MKKLFLIPLLTLFTCVNMWADVETLTSAEELRTFLTKAGTAEGVLTADVDITGAAIVTAGDKTLTLNDDVVVTYKRFSGSYVDNINIPTGAKLTILGNGTFSGNNRAIATVGGELVIGPQDKSTTPHFISTRTDAGCVLQANGGTMTINNIDVYAGAIAIWSKNGGHMVLNDGRLEAENAQTVMVAANSSYEQNGGTIICNASTNHGQYSYAVMVLGSAVLNDGSVSGVHGGVDCSYQNATITINGGSYETRVCPYGGASHYALYVAYYGVVNVYGGKFKSADKRAILCGNEDAYSVMGVVNLYGGQLATKAYVQNSPTSTYPASIPTSSQWYSSFGTDAPLPAGYEYYETGDATYPWGVRAIAGKETAEVIVPEATPEDPEPTISWQDQTTWDADWTEGDENVVPEENTIVTIPAGATVVISKKEEEKDAVADQIFVSQGASLTVEEGTSLTVGDGGLNIGNGGSITVEPGAVIKIGSAGVVTTEEEALIIESSDEKQAVLLYHPDVTENTQPKGTVKLTTKSKMLAGAPDWQYVYQRFAIPVQTAVVPTNDFGEGTLFPGEETYGFENYIFYWDGHKWANCNWSSLQPFKGYQLANNSKNGGVTYTFTGNLIGNDDGEFHFGGSGFDYFGNSYTAPINVETFLRGFGSEVEATIWLYNYDTKNWQQVSLEDFNDGFVDDEFKQIKSMDGFLLNLRAASGSANVDYANAIWDNPLLSRAPARERENKTINNSAVITVKDNAQFGDNLTLIEKENRTNEFENGADASKFMMDEGVSLYAETVAGKLSRVATNDLNNTLISFRSGDNTEYTLTFSKVQGEDYSLRDNITGQMIVIAEEGTYTFSQAANTTVPARFELISKHNAPTAIDNVEANAATHGIYTLTGQFVGNDFSRVPAGVYVINGVKIIK